MATSTTLAGGGPQEPKIGNFWLLSVLLIVLIFVRTSASGRAPQGTHDSPFFDKERLISKEEKIALDKVKAAIAPNITQGWRRDLFRNELMIIRFLRASSLDPDAAIDNIFRFLRLAEKEHLDTILEEDWSDMNAEYPCHTDAVDRQGRPVAYVSMTEGWNIPTQGTIQGRIERFHRYMRKLAFEMAMKLLEANKSMPNVTQGEVVLNVEGLNPMEHPCPLCVQTYLQHMMMITQLLPNVARELIIINASPSLHGLLERLRPLLTKELRDVLKLFDTNKPKWKAYLDIRIDPKELPSEFGGTKGST